jgi:MFS family permease
MYYLRIEESNEVKLIEGSLWNNLQEGMRFVFQTKVVLAVLCLDLFAVLFGGAEALLPAFAHDVLSVGSTGYGWLRSAHSIGAVLFTVVLAFLPIRRNAGVKMLWSVAGFGVCIIGFGLSNHFYLSFAFLFLAGVCDNVSVVIRHSILQLKTPDHLRGRVSSVNTIFISSSNELGAMESGFAAKMLGLIPATVFGGGMTILIVIIVYFLAKELRKLRL